MVRRRVEEKRIEQAVELGQHNAKLWPEVESWCRHLKIQMRSSGMIAQMYNLPVGSIAISCDHASAGGIEAMQLENVAASFIINNCRECPHRSPRGLSSFGNRVIAEWEQFQKTPRVQTNPLAGSKDRLKALVSGDLTRALKKEPTTNQSILELVALLDDDQHHGEAAENLEKAAALAPELFSDLAFEVLCSHFPDLHHGRPCIAAVRTLCQKKRDVPETAKEAVRYCLSKRINGDAVLFIVGDSISFGTTDVDTTTISDVLSFLNYHRSIGFGPPKHQGGDHALIQIATRNPDLLLSELQARLTAPNPWLRFNTCGALQVVTKSFGRRALELVPTLIQSLEKDDDDDFNHSADNAATRTLAHIFAHFPKEFEERFRLELPQLTEEARIIALSTYEQVVREGVSHNHKDAELFVACLSAVIAPILGWLNTEQTPAKAKNGLADALSLLAHYGGKTLRPHLDTLFGTLANLISERHTADLFAPKNQMEGLAKQARLSMLLGAIARTKDAITYQTKDEPRVLLASISDLTHNLSSRDDTQVMLKYHLVTLLSEVTSHEGLVPELLPALYHHLMDMDSALCRSAAIDAVAKMTSRHGDVVPENMRAMLVVYLADTFVLVHQSAARAMRHITPSSFAEALEITTRLANLYATYRKDSSNDPDGGFRKILALALVHVSRPYAELFSRIAFPILTDAIGTLHEYIASDLLLEFETLLPELIPEATHLYAKHVLQFLMKTEREVYNDESHTDRHRLLRSLFSLGSTAIARNTDLMRQVLAAKGKCDPWDALRLVMLAAHLGLNHQAQTLATDLLGLLPKTKQYSTIIRETQFVLGLVNAESALIAGDPGSARQIHQQLADLEAARDAERRQNRPEDILRTIQVAERAARRATGRDA